MRRREFITLIADACRFRRRRKCHPMIGVLGMTIRLVPAAAMLLLSGLLRLMEKAKTREFPKTRIEVPRH